MEIQRVAWKVPSIFSWMCLTVRTLSLALWSVAKERLWLTFVSNEENREDIHGIFQITFKNEKVFHLHMLRLL